MEDGSNVPGGRRAGRGDHPPSLVGAAGDQARPAGRARGDALEVDREALPPTAEDEYYAFELVGLPVVEENGRALGSVKLVTPGVANDVLELDSGVLLPMVEECILNVDLEAGRITVAQGFAE